MDSFLNTINYSSYNEDGTSELKALNIAPNDNVLCITGSGARTLDLLIATPNSIISIDYNPTQNFLLELKITAIRELSYDEFLAFIGIRPSSKRKTIPIITNTAVPIQKATSLSSLFISVSSILQSK